MTKILYLPTGEYLTFIKDYDILPYYTFDVEETDEDEYTKNAFIASLKNETMLFHHISNFSSNFRKRNNIIEPMIERHFEIVR